MLFIQLIAVIVCSVILVNAQNISISIRNTKINGQIKSFNGTQVCVFYGIPYAQPPIGNLRFKEPKPIEMWPKVIDATELPVACMQTPNPLFPFINLGRDSRISEDCLYLNIWTPNSNNKTLKTVMVWIHGGGNIYGSSNQDIYESTILSAKGDVVVVSLNYRLGIFGFLYTGTKVGPGNMALRDQILALKWVKDNIQHFGGDPNKITLFGQAAGSFDTSLLLLSPVSRDLFQRAIMMSGAALGVFNVHEPKEALIYWNTAAKLVNCTDNGSTDLNKTLSPQMIECLLNTTADQLITTNLNPRIAPDYLLYLPYFVSDGMILTNNTLNMIEQGEFNKNIELLIGNTGNEGAILVPMFGGLTLFNPTKPANLTFSQAYNLTKTLTSRLHIKKPINTDDIAKLYFTGLSNQSDPVLFSQAIGLALGDYIITCPGNLFARALFERYSQSVKIYEYVYNSKLGADKLDCHNWMGVCHGQDVAPVFGYPYIHQNTSLDREKEISTQMIQFFTDFAKNGKLSAQNGEEWYSFYQMNNITTAPYYDITNDKKTSNIKTGFKLNECLNLWKHYIKTF